LIPHFLQISDDQGDFTGTDPLSGFTARYSDNKTFNGLHRFMLIGKVPLLKKFKVFFDLLPANQTEVSATILA